MACCHYYAFSDGGDTAFTVDMSAITFGAGCLAEAGDQARALGMRRVALFTDKGVARFPHAETVAKSLRAAGCDVTVYDEVRVEPTDLNRVVHEAAQIARTRLSGEVSPE